ncbi:cap binding protein 80-PB [Cubamyces sp. BRFM 1775]|nr:cap binding protein 80-PB [Cubamyces sp. BRFM 1775]
MSYHGRRRHHRDDHERREVHETPEQKLKYNITHYGEVDPIQELPRLANQIFEHSPANVPAVTEAFRIGVTEQPFKIPYYAALLRLLHDRPVADAAPGSSSFGKQVLEDFWKGFQAFLDKQAWRETRLCVHFFAHLTVARVISVQSMFELLKSFTAVLDEFGVSHGRAAKAGLCAAEGLMIAGPVIKQDPALDVSEIIAALQTYIDSTKDAKTLVQPVVQLFTDSPILEHAEEWLDCALAALQTLNATDFAQTADSYPQPYLSSPPWTEEPFNLPGVLVPPEVIELDGLTTESGEDAQPKKEEWPQCYVSLFDNDLTPDPTTPAGFAIRSTLIDIVDIFEVNRKECARLLLELPKWTVPGTFKPRPGAPPQSHVEGKDWQLESTVLETILGSTFMLPESTYKAIYYIALITELCKSSPQTVGPAVGKSIRRLYALLADGLDVEIAHRFAEWFAVHMSNFGFQWVWKEWIPDLVLVPQHPKRTFMRRAVEFEIRLSYHDRILRILPEPMREPDAQVISAEAPGPEFEYDEPTHPHHESAQSILNLIRGRAKPEDVMSHLESLRNSLMETTENVDSVLRSVLVQSLLHIGSRSFSHFLNAIERYLPLLRNLAAGQISTGGNASPEARTDIMSAVAKFWRNSRHMINIVFDKLMQYQIVDPTDVVAWTFTHCAYVTEGTRKATFNAFQWDLLKSALDKANGRVMVQRRKVAVLRKEADDNAARAIAGESATMEVDAETRPDVIPAGESPQLTSAIKAFTVLTREQKSALARTLDGFVDCLAVEGASPKVREVITEHAWHNRANWEIDDWEVWETWGWYRHWGRTYSPYLRNYMNTIGTVAFAKVPSKADPAVELFRKTWNIATGQEV